MGRCCSTFFFRHARAMLDPPPPQHITLATGLCSTLLK